jgi:hypothetical protein
MKRRRSKLAGAGKADAVPVVAAGPRKQMSPVARRVLFAVGAVALTIVVAVIFLETAMRAFRIVPARHARPTVKVLTGGIPHRSGGILVKTDSRLQHLGVQMGEYVPGAEYKTIFDSNERGYFDRTDNGVLNKINSLGMRGPEIEETKTSGTFRVLAIGDSFTFGIGVRDEDTFVRRLEKQLNAQNTPGVKYEVLNTGIEGYNTRDEIITLEHRWLKLQPDLVLITFYLNDAYADFTFLNRGEAQGVGAEKPKNLAQYSYVFDYAQHALHVRRESRRIKEFYQRQFFSKADEFLDNPGATDVDWTHSKRALERAVALSKQHNFKLALVIFPELYSLNEQYPFKAIHRHVERTCKELGIPCYDLLQAFNGHRDKDLWVHPADHHPNEVAHGIAAETIFNFLQQVGAKDVR